MEVVALEALVFVIAFSVALAVGRTWVVLLAGLAIVFVSAVFAAVGASGNSDPGVIPLDFSPREAFVTALVIGLYLYVGWALGAGAATGARSWAARRG